MLLFSIPDSAIVRVTNTSLFSALKNHKEWFYDDFKIDVAYGCPPNCIWNGNRPEFGEPYPNIWAEMIAGFYKKQGVTYRLNFTNFLLREEHLNDEYGNEIASALNKFGGRVTVSTKLMYDYIKNKYKNLKISWSTTTDYGNTTEEKIEKINLLSENEIVVLPYELNDISILNHFKYPQNLEVLICDMCKPNCSFRRKHSIMQNKVILGELPKSTLTPCLWNEQNDIDGGSYALIGRKQLNEYVERKIFRFKISGRAQEEQALAGYAYYFVLEEYREEFFEYMLKTNYQELVSLGALDSNCFNMPVLDYSIFMEYLNRYY